MSGSRTVSVPRLLQIEHGALDGLADALVANFDPERVLIATGAEVSRQLGAQLAATLKGGSLDVAVWTGLAGSLTDVARLLDHLDTTPVSLVVGVGGGQPIDVAKLAGHRAGVNVVAVPTVLSHDGIASPVASLTAADGRRRSLGARMPAGVVIDLDVVGAAPAQYVRAGIGDLVSNLTATEDWRRAAPAGEPYDEFAATIATLGATAVTEVGWPLHADDLGAVARGLVMSGLAMAVAGSSRPCSGAEHLVSHALDQVRGSASGLHGEHVAIGVLLTAVLQESPHTARIRRLFSRLGFPSSLDGWGLDEDTLVQAVLSAPATRPGRRTVLDEADLSPTSVRRIIRSAFGESTP